MQQKRSKTFDNSAENTRDTVGNKLNMITKTVLPPHVDWIDGVMPV